jgi:6,7-dimethyl-8-ribityllumazine synthase
MVVGSVPLLSPVNEHNSGYLKAKREMEQQLKKSTDSAGHRQLKRSIKSILDLPAATTPVSATTAAATVPEVSAALSAALQEEALAFNAGYAPSVPLGAGCSIETSHITKEMPLTIPDHVDTTKLRVGIVRTLWNEGFVGPLVRCTLNLLSTHTHDVHALAFVHVADQRLLVQTDGCKKGLQAAGVPEKNVVEVSVPGSFELPYAALSLAQSGKVDAVVALGVLIKGETAHFENISAACASGLMDAGLKTGVPVLYGVLNCYTTDQAKARCLAPSQLPVSLGLSAVRMAALKTNAL